MRHSYLVPCRVSTCFGLFLLGLLTACASAPVQEMSDARQAINAAEQAGAEESAPQALEVARKLLTDAESQLQGGRYFAARRNAVQAKTKALEALEATDGDKKKKEAENADRH
ncbi:MAG: DUF4398 domain-containing protein [Gammaproteobacteria bacterium]|nr:DUF4398 domain-containing protein [Gammaproteobacteria bacterium]